MIIGISGISGSGKTHYANSKFSTKKIISLDLLGKNVVMKDEKIIAFLDKKNVNNSILRSLIFNDINFLKELNDITFPIFESEINKIIEDEKDGDVVFEGFIVPLLNVEFDKIINIKSFDWIRIKRIVKRDNITKENAKKMIQTQKELLRSYF